MSTSLTQRINKRALESLVITLKNAGCPDRASHIIRDAFWKTLNARAKQIKSAPVIYEQLNLFDLVQELIR